MPAVYGLDIMSFGHMAETLGGFNEYLHKWPLPNFSDPGPERNRGSKSLRFLAGL